MTNRELLALSLLLGIALLLFVAECKTGKKVDTFVTKEQNNMGGYRYGVNVNTDLEYPQLSITIRNREDFLYEIFSKDEKVHTSVVGKSLKIYYHSMAAGERTIIFIQHSHNPKKSHKMEFPIRYYFTEADKEIVVEVPFSKFEGADLTLGYGIGIGGPLNVNQIELVETSEPSERSSGKRVKFDSFKHVNLSPIIHQPPLEHRNPKSFEYYQNINTLRLPRSGSLITKLDKGVEIGETGYLEEDLVPGTKTIDLTNKEFIVTYSAKKGGTLELLLLGHAHLGATHAYGGIAKKKVAKGKFVSVNVRICEFYGNVGGGIDPFGIKSIRILGPAIIHRIGLMVLSPPPKKVKKILLSPDKYDEFMEVDNLSTWPTVDELARMKTTEDESSKIPVRKLIPQANHVGSSSSFKSYETLNSLKFDCTGDNVQLLEGGGIKLANNGRIAENLARNHGGPIESYDLSNASIEFVYSSEASFKRPLLILIRAFNHLQKEIFDQKSIDAEFHEGNHLISSVDVRKCGQTYNFRLIGSGELTLHQIYLVITNSYGWQERKLLDDFSYWGRKKKVWELAKPINQSAFTGSRPPHFMDPSGVVNQIQNVPPYIPNNRATEYNSVDMSDALDHMIPVKINLFDLQCGSEGTEVLADGIKLSYQGILREPLAPNGRLFDLTGAYIKFLYSAEVPSTRLLNVVGMNDRALRNVRTNIFEVNFIAGEKLTRHIKVGDSGESLGIALVGNGEVTVHCIDLILPNPEGLYPYIKKRLDDFSKWSRKTANNSI